MSNTIKMTIINMCISIRMIIIIVSIVVVIMSILTGLRRVFKGDCIRL